MVANKVEKLLVTNGTQAATVAALTAGQVVTLVQGKANNTPIVLGDKFQLAIKKLNGEVQYTDLIKANDILRVHVEAYRAPQNQVSTVTFTAPVVGNVYVLTIVDKADKEILQRRQDKRTYSITAGTGETATTLAAKFAALITADTSASETATSAAAVLTITAKTDPVDAAGLPGLQHYFEVFLYEQDALGTQDKFGTIATTQTIDTGSGTYAQVKELERTTKGYEGGSLNQRKFPVEIYPSDLVATGTYDLVVIAYDNNYWSNSTVSGKVDSPIEIVIAVTAGATTALEAVFANFLP